MKGIEIPFTFIVFLVIMVVVAALILLWHFGGFRIFDTTVQNVSCDMVNKTAGLTVGCK